MKRALLLLLLAAVPLGAQVELEAGKQIRIPQPDATAAVSLDPDIVDASCSGGVLTISGKLSGDTHVIVMLPAGMREIWIHIIGARPAYPSGFVEPQNFTSENGGYELRGSSVSPQFESILDFRSQAVGKSEQLHVVTTASDTADGIKTFVPSAYYRINTSNGELTFLDERLNGSPLTLGGVTIRGLHLQQGPWQIHGGYTASAAFSDVFLPVEQEFATGIGFEQHVSGHVQFAPSFYVVHSVDDSTGLTRWGAITSLKVTVAARHGWNWQSEIAYGRGLAYAGSIQHAGRSGNFRADIVEKPAQFPSVRSESLPGLLGEFALSQSFGSRFGLLMGSNIDNVSVQSIEQDTANAYGNIRLQVTRSWSLGTGASYGAFTSPHSYSARTMSLPQQISFNHKHFGAGAQYEYSAASHSFASGSGYGGNVSVAFSRWQLGAFVNDQADALSIQSLISEIPGLQAELQALGLYAVTPQQLELLLQSSAFLQALGLSSSAKIVTVPRRLQEGGTLSWSSSGDLPHRLSLSFIRDRDEFVTHTSSDYNVTGSYSKQLGWSNLLQVSGSVQDVNFSGREQISPVFLASFRHSFTKNSAILSSRYSRSISGTVFVDADHRGVFGPGMEPLAGALVVADGHKSVTTGANGEFHFDGLSQGEHRVQVFYDSSRPHYFTSPDEMTVSNGTIVTFGVAFPTLDLWGYVKDDAGNGLEGIQIQAARAAVANPSGPSLSVVAGAGALASTEPTSGEARPIAGPLVATTDGSGKFIFTNVSPGDYTIAAVPDSVSPGYAADTLVAVPARVSAGASDHPEIVIAANRALMGGVTIYDAATGAYVPVSGAVISLPNLALSVSSNAAGKYMIGKIPPGDALVKVTYGGATLLQSLTFSVGPEALHADFRISSVNGQITSTLAPPSN